MTIRHFGIDAAVEEWPLKSPFSIAGRHFDCLAVVVARVSVGETVGVGEGGPVFYLGETVESVRDQILSNASRLEHADRAELLELLPAGAARNALDMAHWTLEARVTGVPVWRRAGLPARPRPVLSVFTIALETPERTAQIAASMNGVRMIKLKLDGTELDAGRILAARRARPDARIIVDANQSWSREKLDATTPLLTECAIDLVEQPVKCGEEETLRGGRYPFRLAADESFQDEDDLSGLVGLFDVVNLKLDKCGGLTRALQIASCARQLGFGLMVGNMAGTSRAMAPAILFAQQCDFVDVDGPTVLSRDTEPALVFDRGEVTCTDPIWIGNSECAR